MGDELFLLGTSTESGQGLGSKATDRGGDVVSDLRPPGRV